MNYASKSGWSSIKEMNSPCNLISYGSLLCWAAESNCPWKEIYLQYVLAVWNGIAIWSAHTATPSPPSPPSHLHHLHPSQSHLPTTPRQALSAGTWGFSKRKACFQPAETTKMLPLINGVLKLKYRPHHRTGRMSGDVEHWSRQKVGDVPSKCKINCGSRTGKCRLRQEKQYFRPRIGES